jgi:septal ring factor EnvC (AmiA/AmiB activator)
MVKNRHLLGGLVVLGAINVLAYLGLISGERDSARALKAVERDLAAARDEQRHGAESQARQTEELKRGLEEAHSLIGQLRSDVEKVETRLLRTRRALEAVEERLDKPAPAPQPGGGKEASR